MLRWFRSNDPLRRHATKRPNANSRVSFVALVIMAAVVVSYITKLILIVPLETASFVVSRDQVRNVTPATGVLPPGAILGTGSQATAHTTSPYNSGSMQVLPRSRFAIVSMLHARVVDTLYVSRALLINATGGHLDVLPYLQRLQAGMLLPASCPLHPDLVPRRLADDSPIRLMLNHSLPVLEPLSCPVWRAGVVGAAGPGSRCLLQLTISACPNGIDCFVRSDKLPVTLPCAGATNLSTGLTVEADTSWRLDALLPRVTQFRLTASLGARFSDSQPYFRYPSAPRLSSAGFQRLPLNPLCNPALAGGDTGLQDGCPVDNQVAEVRLAPQVDVWLTFSRSTKMHLVIIALAAALSGLTVARRLFFVATVATRQCRARRIRRQSLAELVVRVAVAATGGALVLATLALYLVDPPKQWPENALSAFSMSWSAATGALLVVAAVVLLHNASTSSGSWCCRSPTSASRTATVAVRAAFILQLPVMLAFYGPHVLQLRQPNAVTEFSSDKYWLLWLREGLLLLALSILRWVEWFHTTSLFWRPPAAARVVPSDVEVASSVAVAASAAAAVSSPSSAASSPTVGAVRQRRRATTVVLAVQTNLCCCSSSLMRALIRLSFVANLVEAAAMLFLNARHTSDRSIANVTLTLISVGVVASLTGVAGLRCLEPAREDHRNAIKLLQFVTTMGAFVCMVATTVAPWALSSIQEVVAHADSSSLLSNHSAQLSNLAAQVPFLLRTCVFTFSAAVWTLNVALDAEPPAHRARKLTSASDTSSRTGASFRSRPSFGGGSTPRTACGECMQVLWCCAFCCCAEEPAFLRSRRRPGPHRDALLAAHTRATSLLHLRPRTSQPAITEEAADTETGNSRRRPSAHAYSPPASVHAQPDE